MTAYTRSLASEETVYTRSYALDDIQVRPGGDGRTVEAYAAIFDQPTLVVDQDGEYEEVCDKTMFNRALGLARRAQGGWNIPVMYNHGMTLYGTPSDRHTVPIGVPEDIRVDGKGLYTRARFHPTDAADEILEAIRGGSIRAYSFAGAFRKSDPQVPPGGKFRASFNGTLPRVRRLESTLREFGPTPFPIYAGAEVVGVRAEQAALMLNRLPPEEFERLLQMVRTGTPPPAAEPALEDQPSQEVRSEPEPTSAVDQRPVPEPEHSDRQLTAREAILARRAAWIIKQKDD